MIDKQKDFDALIAKVFKTKDGKKVLDFLEERYDKAPVCVAGQTEGQGYYREGQNSMIRMIKMAIIRQEKGEYIGDYDE